MRRSLLVPATAVLAGVLALAGCATNQTGEASPTPTEDLTDASEWVTASGEFGDRPELTFHSDDAPPAAVVQVITEGDGEEVASGDLLVADYLGQVFGGEVFDNSYDRGAPAAFGIGVGQVITGWDVGLVGQTVGSRVLLSIPPDLGYGEGGNPNAGIEGTDTIVFVVDIVGTFGGDSAGEADATPGEELPADGPQVTGALGGPATVTVPEGTTEPTEKSLTVVATGSGAEIADGDVVIAHYALAPFDGTEPISTWENGRPEQLQVVTGGVVEDLVGVTVGSRVLLVIPAEDGQEPAAIVIDLLAIT